jgi:uracil DNA glycosylase superfamily protein
VIPFPSGDPATARLVIIGGSPDDDALYYKRPFAGQTAKELERALGSLDNVFATLVRWERPPAKEKPHDTRRSIDYAASAYLAPGLSACREARVVLALGGDALYALLGLDAGEAWRVAGSVWSRAEAEAIQCAGGQQPLAVRLPPQVHTVVAGIEPAMGQHGARWMMPTIRRVMARARLFATAGIPPFSYSPDSNGIFRVDRLAGLHINLSPSPAEVEAELAAGPVPVLDVETPRGEPHTILMCCVASSPASVVVFDWREPFVSIVKAHLENSAKKFGGHNLSYDHRAFWENGIRVTTRGYDTITLAARLMPPVADRKQKETDRKHVKVRWHGLEACVLRTFDDIAAWKRLEDPWMQAYYQAAFGHRFSPYEWPKLYCSLDGLYNARLLAAQKEMAEAI